MRKWVRNDHSFTRRQTWTHRKDLVPPGHTISQWQSGMKSRSSDIPLSCSKPPGLQFQTLDQWTEVPLLRISPSSIKFDWKREVNFTDHLLWLYSPSSLCASLETIVLHSWLSYKCKWPRKRKNQNAHPTRKSQGINISTPSGPTMKSRINFTKKFH